MHFPAKEEYPLGTEGSNPSLTAIKSLFINAFLKAKKYFDREWQGENLQYP